MKKTLFLSYSWSDKETCKKIDNDLRNFGFIVTLDERNLSYKSNLQNFMESIDLHDFVIILVSDNYLKSYNCLFEIGTLMENDKFKSKALQIILPSANIFKKIGKYEYLNFWDEEINALNKELKNNLSENNIRIISNDLKEIKKIRENLPIFIEFLNSEKGLTLSEIENSKYEYLLKYIDGVDSIEFENSYLFSKNNNIILPLEDFRRHIGNSFKGVIKGHYNYGVFVRIYLKSGYREGLIHRKKFDAIFNYKRVKSLLTIGLEIDVTVEGINFECEPAKLEGGLELNISDIKNLIDKRLSIELSVLLKNGATITKYNLKGLNLDKIPKQIYELKKLNELDLSGNNFDEVEIKRLFSRYLPDLKVLYFNEYIFVNDEENNQILKIKYK